MDLGQEEGAGSGRRGRRGDCGCNIWGKNKTISIVGVCDGNRRCTEGPEGTWLTSFFTRHLQFVY